MWTKRSKVRRRSAAIGAALAGIAAAGPATACVPGLITCLVERVEARCVAAPTLSCLREMRLELLDRMMREAPEASRERFHSQSFELAISSTSLTERQRIDALNVFYGREATGFGEAVRIFADPRWDWRARLDAGDLSGAVAAIPRPDLGVSYQWLDGAVDTIFEHARRAGRVGEVLDLVAAGRIRGSNWDTQRGMLFDRWFERTFVADPASARRIAELAAPERAKSMRLALAATAADPAEIGRGFAAEFADVGTGDRLDAARAAVWRALGFLAKQPTAVRERFLDAMPRFVHFDKSETDGPSLGDPVAKGEVGVLRRLMRRTPPTDDSSDVFLPAPGMRWETIARTLPELDPNDRFRVAGLVARLQIADGRSDLALRTIRDEKLVEFLGGPNGDSSLARDLYVGLLPTTKAKDLKPLERLFSADERREMADDFGRRKTAEALLTVIAEDPASFARSNRLIEFDDDILKATFDLAQERHDCRGMLVAARNRHERSAADLASDLGWVESCLRAADEEKTR